MHPAEPDPTRWVLPDPRRADGDGLVALGADLEPGTLLAAYRCGLFPMPVDRPLRRDPVLAWWSPDPRTVIPLDGLRVPRSLRRSRRRFEIRVDTAFGQVVRGCADPHRSGGWISSEIGSAYGRLHELGWAHSVESWTPDGRLAGGLYGVAIGGLFAGESMYHERRPWARDASKVALVGLVELLRADGEPDRLLDVQWMTPHLERLGALPIPRATYLDRLTATLALPLPRAFHQAGAVGAAGVRAG